jgi:hypothetical protein
MEVKKYLIFYGGADNWIPPFNYHLLYHQDRRVMCIFILIIQHAKNIFYVVVKRHELFITLYRSYSYKSKQAFCL